MEKVKLYILCIICFSTTLGTSQQFGLDLIGRRNSNSFTSQLDSYYDNLKKIKKNAAQIDKVYGKSNTIGGHLCFFSPVDIRHKVSQSIKFGVAYSLPKSDSVGYYEEVYTGSYYGNYVLKEVDRGMLLQYAVDVEIKYNLGFSLFKSPFFNMYIGGGSGIYYYKRKYKWKASGLAIERQLGIRQKLHVGAFYEFEYFRIFAEYGFALPLTESVFFIEDGYKRNYLSPPISHSVTLGVFIPLIKAK